MDEFWSKFSAWKMMVTDNVKPFGKIPGIQKENWIE